MVMAAALTHHGPWESITLRVCSVHVKWNLEQDLDNFSRVLDIDLDLQLDLMEFAAGLIGFPLVNGVYFGLFLCLVYLLCLNSFGPKGECWRSGACSPHWPKAAGIRPVASGPNGPCLPPC
jgi:hypothetical protein